MPSVLPNSPASALRLLHLWHLASLDAPTVAVIWTLGFAWTTRVRLPGWLPLLIALTVWAVYVADRLLDARADLALGRRDRLQERHLFHWHHRRWLAPLAALAAAAAGWILLALVPLPTRHRESLLVAAALLYFTRVHSPWGLRMASSSHRLLSRLVSKELLVGLLFAAGCLLPVWSRALRPAAALALPAAAYALLAWLNCVLIDLWEMGDNTLRHGRVPPVSLLRPGRGAQGTIQKAAFERAQLQSCQTEATTEDRALALAGALASHPLLLALAAAVTAAALAPNQPRAAALIAAAALSALLLALLHRNRNRLTPLTLRSLADLVLLTPILLAVFA